MRCTFITGSAFPIDGAVTASCFYGPLQPYQSDRLHDRILTPDGLRFICASLDNDPEKIGKHMLDMLVKFRNEGLFDIVVEDE